MIKLLIFVFITDVLNSLKSTGTEKTDLLLMQRCFNVWVLTSAFGSLDKSTKSTN